MRSNGYMLEAMKPAFKFLKTGKFECSRCKLNMSGIYSLYKNRGTRAIDGSWAHRVFFECHEKGHITQVGYNKPVVFSNPDGEADWDVSDKSFMQEEFEDEMEYAAMLDHDSDHSSLKNTHYQDLVKKEFSEKTGVSVDRLSSIEL